jgi:hypothetical protein
MLGYVCDSSLSDFLQAKAAWMSPCLEAKYIRCLQSCFPKCLSRASVKCCHKVKKSF